jgi:hypothetical protein
VPEAPAEDAPQDGSGYNNKPLSNHEIDEMMEDWPGYLGTIARNDIKQLKKLPKDRPFGFIMNLDVRGAPGSHWVAIYVDPVEEYSLEYYDPFGRECPEDILTDTIKTIAKQFDSMPCYFRYKWNMVKHQRINNNNCGWHCMNFLRQRANGVPFKTATGFELATQSQVNERENQVKKLKDKFPKFGDLEV